MPAGSHILNIGSMGGYQGSAKFAGLSAYSASKAALACWSECLAEELKPRRIAVNCLCLGCVQTEMLRQAFPDFDAPSSADEMAHFIGDFALNGQNAISTERSCPIGQYTINIAMVLLNRTSI